MNKNELIADVQFNAGLSLGEATNAVDMVFECITETIKHGDSVTVPGFGVFSAVKRAARKGRNPATGEELLIPAHKVVKFKPAKALKDAVK